MRYVRGCLGVGSVGAGLVGAAGSTGATFAEGGSVGVAAADPAPPPVPAAGTPPGTPPAPPPATPPATDAARSALARRRDFAIHTMAATTIPISTSHGSSTPSATSAQDRKLTRPSQPALRPSRNVLGASSTKTTGSVVSDR